MEMFFFFITIVFIVKINLSYLNRKKSKIFSDLLQNLLSRCGYRLKFLIRTLKNSNESLKMDQSSIFSKKLIEIIY